MFLRSPAGRWLTGAFQDMNLEIRLFSVEAELSLLSEVLLLRNVFALLRTLLSTPASTLSRLAMR